MSPKHRLTAHIDSNITIGMPAEISSRLGYRPGSEIPMTEFRDGVMLRRSTSSISKIYIEPTTRCNLSCRTCLRNLWNEAGGDMSLKTFSSILDSLITFDPVPSLFFGGLGEPLVHPDILEMLSQAKRYASLVEIITNGTLLDKLTAESIVDMGVDVVWLSIDGARPESYADVRLGAAFPQVIENASRLRDMRSSGKPHLGIVFVAMQRNIAELPEVIRIGNRLGVDRFLVTNVIPYTEDLQDETLYDDTITIPPPGIPSPLAPSVQLTRMDVNSMTAQTLFRIFRSFRVFDSLTSTLPVNYCPFIEGGCCAISWNGDVSPCLPLLHTHRVFTNNRPRVFYSCSMGNIDRKPLYDIWNLPEYTAFRKRVQLFDFSPCTLCGGCHLSKTNHEDCLGNPFPVCGGCLWAQGVIRCP